MKPARTTAGMVAGLIALALLAGCGEKSQASGATARKPDAKAWESATATHTADGFKAGDKAAWEAQLKARAERGQNEYGRTTAKAP